MAKIQDLTATLTAPIMVICKFYPIAAYVFDNSSESLIHLEQSPSIVNFHNMFTRYD